MHGRLFSSPVVLLAVLSAAILLSLLSAIDPSKDDIAAARCTDPERPFKCHYGSCYGSQQYCIDDENIRGVGECFPTNWNQSERYDFCHKWKEGTRSLVNDQCYYACEKAFPTSQWRRPTDKLISEARSAELPLGSTQTSWNSAPGSTTPLSTPAPQTSYKIINEPAMVQSTELPLGLNSTQSPWNSTPWNSTPWNSTPGIPIPLSTPVPQTTSHCISDCDKWKMTVYILSSLLFVSFLLLIVAIVYINHLHRKYFFIKPNRANTRDNNSPPNASAGAQTGLSGDGDVSGITQRRLGRSRRVEPTEESTLLGNHDEQRNGAPQPPRDVQVHIDIPLETSV